MAKKKTIKKAEKTTTVINCGSTVCTISYKQKDGQYSTINITPMESITIPEEYKNQLIKFINQGLIKIL